MHKYQIAVKHAYISVYLLLSLAILEHGSPLNVLKLSMDSCWCGDILLDLQHSVGYEPCNGLENTFFNNKLENSEKILIEGTNGTSPIIHSAS